MKERIVKNKNEGGIMGTPYKYHNVSLRNEIYSELEDLSNIVVKGHKLSNAETAVIAIKNLKKSLNEKNSNSESRSNGVANHGKTKQEA